MLLRFVGGSLYSRPVKLILGMSKREGIYLSVDYRVSNSKTSEVIDDASVKFLTVRCCPTGLLSVTGCARRCAGRVKSSTTRCDIYTSGFSATSPSSELL